MEWLWNFMSTNNTVGITVHSSWGGCLMNVMWNEIKRARGSIHNLTALHCTTICSVRNVCPGGNEFTYKCANFHLSFWFFLLNHTIKTGIRHFQDLFCAYAMVINEAPVEPNRYWVFVANIALHVKHKKNSMCQYWSILFTNQLIYQALQTIEHEMSSQNRTHHPESKGLHGAKSPLHTCKGSPLAFFLRWT